MRAGHEARSENRYPCHVTSSSLKCTRQPSCAGRALRQAGIESRARGCCQSWSRHAGAGRIRTTEAEDPMIDVRGHRALVTGGTQGVGRAMAIALAHAGADLVVHGLRIDEAAHDTRRLCEAAGVRVALVDGDL